MLDIGVDHNVLTVSHVRVRVSNMYLGEGVCALKLATDKFEKLAARATIPPTDACPRGMSHNTSDILSG